MRRALILAAAVCLPLAAWAHQLTVFASVQDGEVVVESRFSNGNAPRLGEVRVLDGNNQALMTLPLQEDGTARFPLDRAAAGAGLLIEVTTGQGHSNYWILTPEDIRTGMGD
jgi:nickel transport protein